MTTPTMTWTRLTRRLGSDHNPLRRRSDLLRAWLAPAAVMVFLVLGVLVTGAAYGWAHADNAAVRHAQRSWHRVPAVVLRAAPGPLEAGHGANSWVTFEPARWRSGGKMRAGLVPVTSGTAPGTTVPVWLNRSGAVQIPPLTRGQLADRVAVTAVVALTGLAVLLGGLAGAARWLLDRRQLAAWDAAWRAVAPRWSAGG